jgi:hypothetical protein
MSYQRRVAEARVAKWWRDCDVANALSLASDHKHKIRSLPPVPYRTRATSQNPSTRFFNSYGLGLGLGTLAPSRWNSGFHRTLAHHAHVALVDMEVDYLRARLSS